MSPVIIKGLIAAGGVGLGGIGIWQLNEYMAPKTIREKLEREGYKFHGFGAEDNKEEWKNLAQSYKNGNGASDESSRISEVNINSTTVNESDGTTLKNACKKLVDKGLDGADVEKDLNRVRRWCVIAKTTNT